MRVEKEWSGSGVGAAAERCARRVNGAGAAGKRKGCYVVTHQSYLNQLKVMHYLLLGGALGFALVLVDAVAFVLVNALGVVIVDTLVVCNPSCNKLKNYSSINLSIEE